MTLDRYNTEQVIYAASLSLVGLAVAARIGLEVVFRRIDRAATWGAK